MIQQLSIKNFKSVKDLQVSCKKLNVFIGEPNSGKSNIIEALSLQSQNAIGGVLNKEMFRYKTIGNLFYDFNINTPIEVNTGEICTVLKYAVRENGVVENQFDYFFDANKEKEKPGSISHEGIVLQRGNVGSTNVHFYEYKRLYKFQNSFMPHLSVPFGENIPTLLLSNPDLKKWVSELFRSFGYKLMLKPVEGDMSMTKEVDEELYEYPFFSISETLQRLIFYSLAIKSNKKSVLLFDEPESNMFPFYIKDIAERITEDKTNQFFISTHNPYMLGSLLEKSNKNDIAVYIVKMENYQTVAKLCNQKQIEELISLGSGLFFNLDNL